MKTVDRTAQGGKKAYTKGHGEAHEARLQALIKYYQSPEIWPLTKKGYRLPIEQNGNWKNRQKRLRGAE